MRQSGELRALQSDRVDEVFKDCLTSMEERNPDATPPDYAITVEGIVNTYALHPERLEMHRDEIRAMAKEVPSEFLKSGGGGWSFLNLCNRADGEQWTGLHVRQEQLYVLAAGLGMAKFQLPREIWPALPGGVPYIVFDPEAVA